jgi:hypothetical protein
MDNQSPGVTHYVSVSVERGQVKTSCSAHYTTESDDDKASYEGLAAAMSRSMAVATLAHQSILTLLTEPLSPELVGAFIRKVNAVAEVIAHDG